MVKRRLYDGRLREAGSIFDKLYIVANSMTFQKFK
jgi:hypothetical protein